jgi:hypothetical protein
MDFSYLSWRVSCTIAAVSSSVLVRKVVSNDCITSLESRKHGKSSSGPKTECYTLLD